MYVVIQGGQPEWTTRNKAMIETGAEVKIHYALVHAQAAAVEMMEESGEAVSIYRQIEVMAPTADN
jgi:hypothetical protein